MNGMTSNQQSEMNKVNAAELMRQCSGINERCGRERFARPAEWPAGMKTLNENEMFEWRQQRKQQ